MATAAECLPQTTSFFPFQRQASTRADGLAAFTDARPRLFAIAYRMLRNAADAEDIVQDVWLLWQSANRSAVEKPYAFLATTTKRLCINVAQSARSRHETYNESWCLDQVDTSTDPGLGTERGEALCLAVLVLLEKLTPAERAAYILREAFDYSYRQIANILQMEEANTRQLVSRARKHIADNRRQPVSSAEQRRLLEAFVAAAHLGNLPALEGLFAESVVPCRSAAGLCAQRLEFLDANVWRTSWPSSLNSLDCYQRPA